MAQLILIFHEESFHPSLDLESSFSLRQQYVVIYAGPNKPELRIT